MSISHVNYVVLGYKLGFGTLAESIYDNHDLLYGKNVEIGFINDGMCGEYSVFGKIIAQTDDTYFGEATFDGFTMIQHDDFESWDTEGIKILAANLGVIPHTVMPEPSIIIFTHTK